ncbi:MAG: Gldg family protein [Fimbriiglobus sp.]|jgi:hypothetical protein|nr:Gldg family protein [Fimbriiglobus sp.]
MTLDPAPDRGFIDFIHARRAAVGAVLLALAIGCMLAAGYFGFKGLNLEAKEAKTDVDTVVEFDRAPYMVGLVASVVAALGLGGVGAFFLGRVPAAGEQERRRTDRVLLLVGGYVFGLANRVCGLFLFVWWYPYLAEWVGGKAGSQNTGWMPVAALLEFLVGAGVTFLATLPARSEERNDPWIRRTVYAVNFALSGVLLVVGLVLGNAVVSMKLPDKLDTTATGFYTLTDQTQKYLAGLKQPIKAYAITAASRGDRTQDDALRLLDVCRQVNPALFEVERLSVESNAARIEELQQKYKTAELRELGILLVSGQAGQASERTEHVPFQGMSSGGRGRKRTFIGESKLVAGMMALTEERRKVYYTRGSGELALDPPADPNTVAVGRPATRLKEALAATQCDAAPLDIPPLDPDPKVPDDAAAVLVLDPTAPLPPATATAIQKYMAAPRAGGKKGKLLVYAGGHNAANGELAKTGLEPALAELGLALVDRVVFAQPVGRTPPNIYDVLAVETPGNRRNPITLAAAGGLTARNARPIELSTPRGTNVPVPLLVVAAEGATWVEKGVVDPPRKAWDDLLAANRRRDAAYQQERQVSTQDLRFVGMALAEPDGKPVAAVFGFADGLTDDEPSGRAVATFQAAVGWLRERPPAPDITPKEYAEYTPRKGVSGNLLFTVPFAGTLIAIVLLGLGVWAIRRK